MTKTEDNQGWVSIHRKLLDNPIIGKPDYLSVWVILLLLANHQEHSFIWNNEKQICKRGQVLTGRKKLARVSGVNENKVERILKYLESEQQIEQQKTTKFRLITIKNYNQYQDKKQQNEQQVNNKRTTSEQQVNTNNNDNNYNNDNNISKDIQKSDKSIKKDILVLMESEPKEKSSAKKENVEYGNAEVNQMLGTIKELLFLEDFKETKKMQRNLGKHLVNLKNKLGQEEFRDRFLILGKDQFHLKNMGSLQYLYKQIKGFVPLQQDNSIKSFT